LRISGPDYDGAKSTGRPFSLQMYLLLFLVDFVIET